MENVTFSPEKLKGAGQLLKESWIFYRNKIRTILGILIIPVGFSILSGISINLLSLSDIVYSFWFSLILALTFLLSFFFWFWAIPSLLYCFKDSSGFKQSYKKGLPMLVPYAWVYILLAVIIAGGFSLFVIPGFLFSVWLSLSFFVLIFEEKKGFDCLFRSRQLIRGNFWAILLRFLTLILITGIGLFLLALLASFATANKQIVTATGALFGYFAQLFLLPFFLIYGMLIYKNLKEVKSGIVYEKSPKTRKIKYLVPGALGALIFGLWLGISFLNIFWGRDIAPIDDSDLRLSKVEIPEDENAFFLLFQAGEKLDIKHEKGGMLFHEMAKGESWDPEFAQDLIESNQEVFELFEKALELSYLQIPELQDPEIVGPETIIPGISGFRNIANLNLVKANYLLSQGEEKEALDLAVKTIKMGQMIEDMPRPALIGYLVAIAVKEIGSQGLKTMIPSLTLSPETLKDYMAQLERFKEGEQELVRVWKMEYMFFNNTKSIIDAAFSGQPSKENVTESAWFWLTGSDMELFPEIVPSPARFNYLYKPNKTQKIFAEYFQNHINNAEKDCYQLELAEPEIVFQKDPLKILFAENVIGKIFYEIMAVSPGGVFDKKCSKDFSITATQLLLAMKAFRAENGKLPVSLSDLVPEYISRVPKDPFDGEQIRYLPEEKTIYSPQKNIIFQIDF